MPNVALMPPVLAESALREAGEIKRRWREGSEPDAQAALADHSSLAAVKSIVIDLAYEEYCLREQDGNAPDADAFCARFPRYRTSIRRVLDAHQLLADQPNLLDAEPVDWPMDGSLFEGLEVLGELGRGSFARAYLMYDPATDRHCVLKLSTARSLEARVIGSLHHPHITEIYWARRVGRLNAVCMPLVGLSTLEDIRDALFPEPTAAASADAILAAIEPVGRESESKPSGASVVRPGEPCPVGVAAIAARIADALGYLHESGTSHGDLKPSNVVLGPGGHPYLIDFNLSSTGKLNDGTVGGTLPYMAPELLRQMLGAKETIDPAQADVYAFGAMIFELLTGLPPVVPLTRHDPKRTAADLLTQGIRPLPPETPEPLARVIRKCLMPDGVQRPTARQAGRMLEAYLRIARGERWLQRVRTFLLALCGVAAIAGIGLASRTISMPESAVVAAAPASEPETAEDFFARGLQFLHRDHFPAALNDFMAASRLKAEPTYLAFSAYCAARMGQQNVAAAFGQKAVDAGAASPAVYNNLGYSLMKSAKPKMALTPLDQAIRRDPLLQAARYNRALARQQIAIGPGGPGSDAEAAEDIEIALSGNAKSADLYYDAARICAACTPSDPARQAEVLRWLEASVARGKNPAIFQREPSFKALAALPEFQRILSLQPGPSAAHVNLQLLEPPSP